MSRLFLGISCPYTVRMLRYAESNRLYSTKLPVAQDEIEHGTLLWAANRRQPWNDTPPNECLRILAHSATKK